MRFLKKNTFMIQPTNGASSTLPTCSYRYFLIPNLKMCDLLDVFLIHNIFLLIRLPCSMGKFVCGPLDLIAHGHFIMLMAGKGQKRMENHILLPLIPTVWLLQYVSNSAERAELLITSHLDVCFMRSLKVMCRVNLD